MKRILTICMLLASAWTLHAQSFETAAEAVKNMGVGWNLGNTLDANDGNLCPDIVRSETMWGQPVTKPELMKMMKEAGFGAIRVPVTWYPHMDANDKVDPVWMARVHEVVDYVLDNGMYCILNVHHDTGDGKQWLHASMNTYNNVKERYEYLWKQIAEEFKDYGEKLLFESYNEMLDEYNSWCFASYASPNRYDATSAADSYEAINKYAQSFVDVVRATGGNNAKRNLVVNTYGACSGGGNWNAHLQDPLKEMKLPTDATAGEGHLAFQIHAYPNLTTGKSEIDDIVNHVGTYLQPKAPVILGEWGTSNVDANETDYQKDPEKYLDFVQHLVKKTKEKNIATFYWMGLSDGVARSLAVFNQAEIAENIVKAYHGSEFQGQWPTIDDLDLEYTVKYTGDWQELNLYSGTALKISEYKAIRLELAKAPAANALQIKVYGDVVNGSAKESYNPLEKNGLNTTITFDSSKTGETITRVTLQTMIGATEATINRAVLIKRDNTEVETELSVYWGCTLECQVKQSTDIKTLKTKVNNDNIIYNLNGHQVTNPQQGIFIKNGKKYIINRL